MIACLPPKNEDQKTKFKQDYLNRESLKPDMRCLVKLLFENKIESTMNNIPFAKGRPLHEQLKGLRISIRLKMAESPSDSETTLDLLSLI